VFRVESGNAYLTIGHRGAVAEHLVRQNPGMTFVYVSGAGTDSTADCRCGRG
jgi:hypothetical protein